MRTIKEKLFLGLVPMLLLGFSGLVSAAEQKAATKADVNSEVKKSDNASPATFQGELPIAPPTPIPVDGQSVLKSEVLGVILPAEGPMAKAVEREIESLDRAMPFPKAFYFVIKKVSGGPKAVFEVAKELSEHSGSHFIFSALGSYDSSALIKGDLTELDTVVAPFLLMNEKLSAEKAEQNLVTSNLSQTTQGSSLGAWASKKYHRSAVFHSIESEVDLDFALGFERTFRKMASGKFQITRLSFNPKDLNFETYKDFLKNNSPEILVFPSNRKDLIEKFKIFLKSQNYSGTVVGSEGWFSPETMIPEDDQWIGNYVVSVYPGPFVDESAKHAEYSMVREALRWASACMEQKQRVEIKKCLAVAPRAGLLEPGGRILRLRKQPILWQINKGAPRKIQDLELLKAD